MKKFLKWFLIVLFTIVLVTELGLLATGNLYVNKLLSMTIFKGKTGPDIDELAMFPSHRVDNAAPQPWNISTRYARLDIPDSLLHAMEGYKTVSYLVIDHDSIVYEKYWEGYSDSSYVNSFSMAKSINSMLIGCALKEGLIGSVKDPVSKYLPEFAEGKKSHITIEHLLTMSSGLNFKEQYANPFSWPAEAYYGPDVNKLTMKADALSTPGETWYYKGGDSQLLGIILQKVLRGKTIADYASEKLWKPLGAEHPAFWSTDEQGMEKVSCCWYTNARDYARIVKLMMHDGNWNGKQIIDSSYVTASLKAATLMDRDGKPSDKYGYQWWLLSHKGHPVFYMRGIRGQYVFAVPDLDMIIVRLGHKRDPVKKDDLPLDIYTYLDAAFALH